MGSQCERGVADALARLKHRAEALSLAQTHPK